MTQLKQNETTQILADIDHALNLLNIIKTKYKEHYKESIINEDVTDWSKVAIDTPIIVRNSDKYNWVKRYFKEYKDGFVYSFMFGETSRTSSSITKWKQAKLDPTAPSIINWIESDGLKRPDLPKGTMLLIKVGKKEDIALSNIDYTAWGKMNDRVRISSYAVVK